MSSSMLRLIIGYQDKIVGTLEFDESNDQIVLKYDEKWITSGFALSPSLPLNGNFENTATRRFIENLLPEGEGLEVLSIYLKISKNNVFGLIGAIGAETVGALTFYPQNTDKPKTMYRRIEQEELIQRINEKAYKPITLWDGKPRLSVAGVQEKLPLMYIDDEYGLGDGNLCSTHILKFEKNKENLILNEFLSLELAKAAGLSVCNAQIKQFGEHYTLLVERFDREIKEVGDGKIADRYKIIRKHMIDACQALGLSSSFKYERPYGSNNSTKHIRTGVSFEKLGLLIKQCAIPAKEKLALIEWIIVNLCLGNTDAHGKNISFFIDDQGLRLTPFYDLLNISLYAKSYDTSLAMAVGDEFELSKIAPYDIASLCDILEVKPTLFIRSFQKIAKKITSFLLSSDTITQAKQVDALFVDKYIEDIITRIEKLEHITKASKEAYKVDHAE